MSAGAPGWGIRDMRRRCEDLREVLAASPELCTPEELTEYWPGGAENKLPSPGCWIYCYACYMGMLWGLKHTQQGEDPDEDRAHRAAIAAFREQPVTVELVDLASDGAPRTLTVYPKSYDAIAFVDELDGDVRWLLAQVEKFGETWGAEHQLKRSEALQMVTELHLLMCWVATHEGPEIPGGARDTAPPIPDTIRTLSPYDVVQVLRGYLEVNRNRVALMTRSVRPTSGEGERVSFAVLGVAAVKAAGGGSVEDLFRRRSLGGWLGQAVLTWSAEEAARAKADARTRTDRDRDRLPEMVG